ncbi:MAG TPA: helix-turn-helix transcriptional regulator [Brumimicrobium sp.]|nr:helix-turn-helix transcriptional regulator [Brumimicrobium sp.]
MKRNAFLEEIRKEIPEETKVFVRHHADIVIRVNELLEKKGWTQKKLAESMGKKPSEINKWLKGEHNFTLRSLSKLEVELGESIFNVVNTITNHSIDSGNVKMTIHRNFTKPTIDGFKKADTIIKNKNINLSA